MFSRIVLNPRVFHSLVLRSRVPNHGLRATSNVPTNLSEREKYLALLKEELPKPYDGPERDLINFPRLPRIIYPGKIRMGFIPEEWFQFFYKKTGVTGPYLFGAGLITFLLSKELFVIEEEFSTGVAMFILCYIAIKKLGPSVKNIAEEEVSKKKKNLEDYKYNNIKNLEDSIVKEKRMQFEAGGQKVLIVAKKENIQMQLETEYRSRMMNVYEQVKKRLDYHLNVHNTQRKMEQKHMVDWIHSNVVKSITAQQEKEALQKCIQDLKVLSSRA